MSELVAVVTLHLLPSATVVSTAPALASTSSSAFSFALSPFPASALSAVTHSQSDVAAVRVSDRADEGIIVGGEGGDDPVYEDTILEW